MSVLLCGLAGVFLAGPGAIGDSESPGGLESPSGLESNNDASYIDASVRVDGELLAWRFVDIDEDGQAELVIPIRTPRGKRELHLHRTTKKSINPKPYLTIPILKDIVAWTFADVRPELEGKELVLLTRRGAWSFDPRKPGYKGNIQKLLETDLLYDVPSPRALPYWSYVLDRTGQPDRLLLPQRSGFQIFGPVTRATDDALPWGPITQFHAASGTAPIDPDDHERRAEEAEADNDRRRVRFSATIGDSLQPFLGTATGESLVDDSVTLQAPALVDVDGDGRPDMVLLDGNQLKVHIATSAGIPEHPTRVEELPEYLRRENIRAALRIVDIDGDGDVDVLGLWSEDISGLENGQWRVFVMHSTKTALLPAKPTQVLRFEAAELNATIADVDGDGRPDLAIRRFQMPSMLETVTGLEFRFAHILYLGRKDGTFDRRPALKSEKSYDEESIREVIANRILSMDCSGDGIADLVEIDLAGTLAVRRLRKESSFFGADTWKIDEGYWKRYASRGSVSSLEVLDLNNDGLGDIVSASKSVLTVYLSQRR